eukprot:TRINITY_DN67753_c9_g4_i2.p1 TRINITY_DN67753_c9_g4~~TRINITY_DN67753_c9_g4_i2.p1  ORF type:complete len:454 (+),score=251.40 TRINITY_DN67753_c9_g4_i2:18-1379(+)
MKLSKAWMAVAVVALLATAASAADDADDSAGGVASNVPTKKPDEGSAAEEHSTPSSRSVEVHHSLHRPLDSSQVYWNFGGATVMTKNFIRLTPATANRKGWLWNDYPIESDNWEVEFQTEIFSKPHFGGDGMALWFLEGSMDPTFNADPSWLNGDVFGMRNDFKGMGVVFDVYDNDGRRDNPAVSVLYNPKGEVTNYNHDNDYQDDVYKRLPSDNKHASYSCIANIRNTGSTTSWLVKFINKVLHVYVNTDDGLGYKYCLSVEFDRTFRDHHIAFTGVTGQVADHHDLMQVSTKYLSSGAKGFNDEEMLRLSAYRGSGLSAFFWLLVTGVSAGLLVFQTVQVHQYRQQTKDDINPTVVCMRMNTGLLLHYLVHAVLTLLVLLSGNWKISLLNLPLAGYRFYLISKHRYKLSPAALDSDKVHASGLSFLQKMYLAAGVYAVSTIYYLVRLYRAA